jgi:hypothetical protein
MYNVEPRQQVPGRRTIEATESFMILVVEVLDSKGFLFEESHPSPPEFIRCPQIKI